MELSLLRLPEEILTVIVSGLDNGQDRQYGNHGHPDLCALALTCKLLCRLACVLLPRHMRLDTFNPRDRDRERLNLFNRSCAENPSVRKHVRFVAARLGVSIEESQQELEKYNIFLLNCRSASRLKIELHPDRANWSLQALFQAQPADWPNLQSLDLRLQDAGSISVQYLLKVCSYPRLERIHLHAIIGTPEDDSAALMQSEPPTFASNLKELCLCCTSSIRYSALSLLLPYLPNLVKITIEAPGRGEHVNRIMSDNSSMLGTDLLEPFRPATIGRLLRPVQTQLRTLTLTLFNVRFSHDGSRIDLTDFTSLDVLRLSSYYLFGTDTEPNYARCGAWKLLPRNIKSLHIKFDGMQGIFYSLSRSRLNYGGQSFRLWPSNPALGDASLTWIDEVIRSKPDTCPSLRRLTISEDEFIDREQTFKLVKWSKTDELARLCQKYDVDVDFGLRVPEDWESGTELIYDDFD